MATSNHNNPNLIPNMDEPLKPLIIITIPNSITLTPTNYLSWKTQVEAVLIGFDLFDKHIINTTTTIPPPSMTTPAYQTWFRQDKLIFAALIGTISNDVVPLVCQAKTTHELWNILANTFDKPNPNHTIDLNYPTQNNVSEFTPPVIDLTSPPSSPSNECTPVVRKYKRRKGEERDRISNLPDEIMVHILSYVDIKSAGRSSLLSKRWRYVWTYLVDLVLEDPEYFDFALPQLQLLKGVNESQVKTFSTMVNKIIASNSATYLNSFRIRFPLRKFIQSTINNYSNNDIYSNDFSVRLRSTLRQLSATEQFYTPPTRESSTDFDKWINFAFAKKVRNLELNMSDVGYASNTNNSYTIRENFFLTQQFYNDHLNFLKSLHLEGLNMDGPVLENVLAYCLNLESLTVRSLSPLQRNYISGVFPTHNLGVSSGEKMKSTQNLVVSSDKLKYLEIRHCNSITSLKISAPKLTSFVYFAKNTDEVEYANVSSLVNVTFGYDYGLHILHNLHLISSFSRQLEMLTIHWNRDDLYSSHVYPTFPKENILCLTSFIETCPMLHTFKLELWLLKKQPVPMQGRRDVTNNHKMPKHDKLKVLELVGFDGSASLAEFVFCVNENAPMLKKIICDPHCPQSRGNIHKWYDLQYSSRIDPARRQAELLAQLIQGGVDVVIR